MRSMKMSLIVLVAAAGLVAQPQAEPALVSAVIPVKTLSGDAFGRLVKLLGAFKVSLSADDQLRTILVYAPKDVVAQVKRVVEELDRPGSPAAIGRDIDLTLTLLRCSIKAAAEAGEPLTAELEAVVKQVRAATPYKHVQVWDVVPMRIQEGKQTEQTARLPGKMLSVGNLNPTLNIRVQPDSISLKGGGRSVRFERFNMTFRIPYTTAPGAYQFMDMSLNTSGDFKEAQKTVIGKVGLDDDTAVFVVVALKVLD